MAVKEQLSQQDYVKKCKKAAEQGHVIAQNTLGFLYLNGQGVNKDYAEAVKWYRRAANKIMTWLSSTLPSCINSAMVLNKIIHKL